MLWKMIFLFKRVIFRFQPLIFQDVVFVLVGLLPLSVFFSFFQIGEALLRLSSVGQDTASFLVNLGDVYFKK